MSVYIGGPPKVHPCVHSRGRVDLLTKVLTTMTIGLTNMADDFKVGSTPLWSKADKLLKLLCKVATNLVDPHGVAAILDLIGRASEQLGDNLRPLLSYSTHADAYDFYRINSTHEL
nr:hypothetical protein HmN_000963100 [Hymenolepis microstoma]